MLQRTPNFKFGMVLCVLAGLGMTRGLNAGVPEPPETEWKKFETKLIPLNPSRPAKSPGLYDRGLLHVLTFPPNGAPVDTGLPHAGNDKAGKPRPPILGRFVQDHIWIDFDGDGKQDLDEVRRINSDGWSDVFSCELFYDDGTSGKYSFRMKTIVEKEKYALVRAVAHTFEYNGKAITLLDDDGNGKYNDAGRDTVFVDGQPACLLGKHMYLGDTLVEIIVHASGSTVEVRPAAKDLVLGAIDPFSKYEQPQKAENLKIHTLIFCGPQGSFAFDETHRLLKVPADAYDLTFGLFERANETMYVKKGEKTSFNVTGNVVTQIKWGGKVKVKFTLNSDGEEVTVSAPHFIGQLTEEYFPELGVRTLNCTARMSIVFKDKTRFDIDGYVQFGQKRFDFMPDGEFKPLIFRRYRTISEEYEGSVEYTSGIIGRVEGRERLSFVYKKKEQNKSKVK